MSMATMMIGVPVAHEVGVGVREGFAVITAIVSLILLGGNEQQICILGYMFITLQRQVLTWLH